MINDKVETYHFQAKYGDVIWLLQMETSEHWYNPGAHKTSLYATRYSNGLTQWNIYAIQ